MYLCYCKHFSSCVLCCAARGTITWLCYCKHFSSCVLCCAVRGTITWLCSQQVGHFVPVLLQQWRLQYKTCYSQDKLSRFHGFSGSSFCPKHGPSIFHCEFSLCLKEFSTRLDGSESSATVYNLLQPLGIPFFYTACASLAYRGHYD